MVSLLARKKKGKRIRANFNYLPTIFREAKLFVSLKSKILYAENQIKMIPNEELKTKEFDQRGKYFASSVRQIK